MKIKRKENCNHNEKENEGDWKKMEKGEKDVIIKGMRGKVKVKKRERKGGNEGGKEDSCYL